MKAIFFINILNHARNMVFVIYHRHLISSIGYTDWLQFLNVKVYIHFNIILL